MNALELKFFLRKIYILLCIFCFSSWAEEKIKVEERPYQFFSQTIFPEATGSFVHWSNLINAKTTQYNRKIQTVFADNYEDNILSDREIKLQGNVNLFQLIYLMAINLQADLSMDENIFFFTPPTKQMKQNIFMWEGGLLWLNRTNTTSELYLFYDPLEWQFENIPCTIKLNSYYQQSSKIEKVNNHLIKIVFESSATLEPFSVDDFAFYWQAAKIEDQKSYYLSLDSTGCFAINNITVITLSAWDELSETHKNFALLSPGNQVDAKNGQLEFSILDLRTSGFVQDLISYRVIQEAPYYQKIYMKLRPDGSGTRDGIVFLIGRKMPLNTMVIEKSLRK